MKSVYAYIRVSTVKQGERGSSLQEQQSAIEGYARRNNLSIIQWFEETETAAKRGRRVFNQMLTLLRKGTVSGVIIHKIDRSARNLRDWADIGDLIDQGIEVHFAHETLDLQSRGGRLSADIQAVVAADYIRNLRDEVRKGFYGRLKQGFYPLPAPVGYLDQGGGKEKTLDPMKAPLVRRLFELYATGTYSLGMLLTEAERMGLTNRHGGKISLSGLSTILNSEFYFGLIRIDRTGETFKGNHPPLVSMSLFDAVQARLTGRRRNQGLKYDALYRKALRCAICGYFLVGEVQKGATYYRCHTKTCSKTCISEADLTSQAKDAVELLRFFPDDYEELAKEFKRYSQEAHGNEEDHLKAVTLQLSQIEERLSRLTDAYLDRLIDKEIFETRKALLLKDRVKLEERLGEIRDGKSGVQAWMQGILELLERLTNPENGTNPYDVRDTLEKISSNLRVERNSLVFDWKKPFGELVDRDDFRNGGPYRGTHRTCRERRALMDTGIGQQLRYRGKRNVARIVKSIVSTMDYPLDSTIHPPSPS